MKDRDPLLKLIKKHKINATHLCRVANAEEKIVDHGFFKKLASSGRLTPVYQEAIGQAVLLHVKMILRDASELDVFSECGDDLKKATEVISEAIEQVEKQQA